MCWLYEPVEVRVLCMINGRALVMEMQENKNCMHCDVKT